MNTTARNIRDWPLGLLDDLFGGQDSIPELPADFEGSLTYVLSTLDQRTRGILIDRYGNHMTLEAISRNHGVTTERVRQIISKGMRMLRHPSRLQFIRYGVNAVIVRERVEAAARARARAEIEVRQKILLEYQNDPNRVATAAKLDLYDIRIGELNLSKRSYNCLLRYGCKNVGDILKMTTDELARIRNLGRKSHDEIVNELESMGFDCLHLRRKE